MRHLGKMTQRWPAPWIGQASFLFWFAVVLTGLACSGAREHTCPDPIGQIIRDDCEVYRTRYETLKVELGASIGPLEAKTALGQTSLRDPSELIQVLGLRLHALCRDFNACRVPPLEYRRRREAADRVFTGVAAIQEQLKGELDTQSKARLVESLVRLLSEDTTPAPTGTTSAAPPRKVGLKHYASSVPWFGAKHLPPRPAGKAGFPQLIWISADLSVSSYKESPNTYRTDGYCPRVNFALRGQVEPDDTVSVQWEGGVKTEKPVGQSMSNDVQFQSAEAPEDIRLKGSSFSATVTYRRGRDGQTAVIGQRIFPALSSEEQLTGGGTTTHYSIDVDPLARQGQLIFRPFPEHLPASFDQPHLFVVLKLRKYRKPTMRCWVNGATMGSAIVPNRFSGQEETFQDRPRYENISPSRSRSVGHPFIEWWHYNFPLPYVVARTASPRPAKMEPWPKAGKWRCVVSVEGEPLRELTFQVKDDGMLVPHPRQLAEARAAWLVETKIVPNPIEEPPFSSEKAGHAPQGSPAVRGGAGGSGREASSPGGTLRFSASIERQRGSLSRARLSPILATLKERLGQCLGEGGGGTFRLKVHVYPDGKAGVNLEPTIDSWLRYCFSGAVGQARFPKGDEYTYFDYVVQAPRREQGTARGPLRAWNIAGSLSAEEILQTIQAQLSRIAGCARKNPQRYRLKIAVGTDGALEVLDWAQGYHPAVMGCLNAALRTLRFRAATPYTTATLELSLL